MSEWQPIESAPKDGTFVLLYDDSYEHSPSSYLLARYDSGIWWGQKLPSGKAEIWREATHWMPLPEPPAALARQEEGREAVAWRVPTQYGVGYNFASEAVMKDMSDWLNPAPPSAGEGDADEWETTFGWLVENGKQGDALRYRTIEQGIPTWTDDHGIALRFARREDAERFASEDDAAWRIAEHGWSKRKRLAIPAPLSAGEGDGPGHEDGCSLEGFIGGCKRMGCHPIGDGAASLLAALERVLDEKQQADDDEASESLGATAVGAAYSALAFCEKFAPTIRRLATPTPQSGEACCTMAGTYSCKCNRYLTPASPQAAGDLPFATVQAVVKALTRHGWSTPCSQEEQAARANELVRDLCTAVQEHFDRLTTAGQQAAGVSEEVVTTALDAMVEHNVLRLDSSWEQDCSAMRAALEAVWPTAAGAAPEGCITVQRGAVNALLQFGTCHEMSSEAELHVYVEARDLLLNMLAAAPNPGAQHGQEG